MGSKPQKSLVRPTAAVMAGGLLVEEALDLAGGIAATRVFAW